MRKETMEEVSTEWDNIERSWWLVMFKFHTPPSVFKFNTVGVA